MLPKTAKDTKDSQSRLDFFLMCHPIFNSYMQNGCIKALQSAALGNFNSHDITGCQEFIFIQEIRIGVPDNNSIRLNFFAKKHDGGSIVML